MDPAPLVAALGREGRALAAAAARTPWDAAVPGLEWDVRQLLVHTGAVHRWATDAVRRRLATNETGGSRAFHPGLPDDELLDWYAEGLDALVDTLTAMPADAEVFTFVRGPSPRDFWVRRQALETAVHRVDAQGAHGAVSAVDDLDADLAQQGLDELLTGFARQRAFATDQPGVLVLRADDGDDWTVRFGGERTLASRGADAGADAVVSGSSSDLYRWAWNRPSPARVEGDDSVVALWRRVRI